MDPLTLVLFLFLSFLKAALATPCIAFDSPFNLYAFGLDGKDWNAGAQDAWASSTGASDITTSGRPPFDGPSPTCYLSQFTNAIYVMGADTANPASVYIYDAATKSWSAQSVNTGTFDPTSYNAILDHDTNVFYALSKGELFFLDMGSLTSANSSALSWVDVEKAPFDTNDNYQPVMALAQNHIHFLDVPGVTTGSADIFVIHFSYFQPTPQAYPLPNGSAFPAMHGQATSFFQTSGVQQEFAFIPDDGSATYVINVETNTTAALAGPKIKDSKATYFASITALVQLDSTGVVSFLPYQQNNTTVNAAASWSIVASLASVAPASSSTTGNSTSTGPTQTRTSSPSASKATSGTNGNVASLARKVDMSLSFAIVLGLAAALL